MALSIKPYIENKERIHLIGIGGSSMSGLAGMLVKLGVRVTGSDSARSYTTDALEQSGIHVFIGQRAENVDGADIVMNSVRLRDCDGSL